MWKIIYNLFLRWKQRTLDVFLQGRGTRRLHFTSNDCVLLKAGSHSSHRAVNIYHKTRHQALLIAENLLHPFLSKLAQIYGSSLPVPSTSLLIPGELRRGEGGRAGICIPIFARSTITTILKIALAPVFPC